MKKKKIILIFIPILIVLIVVGILIGNHFKNDEHNQDSSSELESQNYTYSTIYLSSNDNVLVPLTVKYDSFSDVGQDLFYVVSLLKKDSEASNKFFNGLIPSETKINSITLKDKTVSIDFDESFFTYEAKDELRLLESLVWTLCDYPEIDSLILSVDGKTIDKMLVNNTPISYPLNKKLGINNFLLTNSIMGKGERVLSYYQKEIDDKNYYVPVTHYVTNDLNLSIYDLTINTLFKEPGITSNLEVCDVFKDTMMVSSCILTDYILYVSLTEDILFDETTVSLDIYKLIKLTTCLLNDVNDVSFLMDLEEVMVNTNQSEEVQVSQIILNNFYI